MQMAILQRPTYRKTIAFPLASCAGAEAKHARYRDSALLQRLKPSLIPLLLLAARQPLAPPCRTEEPNASPQPAIEPSEMKRPRLKYRCASSISMACRTGRQSFLLRRAEGLWA